MASITGHLNVFGSQILQPFSWYLISKAVKLQTEDSSALVCLEKNISFKKRLGLISVFLNFGVS